MLQVNTNFDAGSVVLSEISNDNNLRFTLRQDTNSHFAQWFYFQLNNIANRNLTLNLECLATSAYPDAWQDYNVCASYDNKHWWRIETRYNEKVQSLQWQLETTVNSVYFAYFEPYSYLRHLALIGLANLDERVKHHVLGLSLNQRNLDLLHVGEATAKYKIWIIARQHPGETMAEWFMEGLIRRLLNEDDAVSQNLLKHCVFYLVPNMNPDGGVLGNLRTNAAGVNLNREWLTPSIANSPEVFVVREKMLMTGVDYFFDIHGDEKLPYVFTAGCMDNPNFSEKQKTLEDKVTRVLPLINPDYQITHGYQKGHFSQESASLASNWVGAKFDCLALTLEMPFKDNANLPNKKFGWSAKRSWSLGESWLTLCNFLIMKT